MLVKPFAHGKGSGDAAVYYLLRMDYHGRQEHPPNILRGDPEMTKELINSIDRKWKFTAGVCSWSGEDIVTPEQEVEVMNRFEELAFAGLEHDQYDILWVRHSHANHHELHFVMPRMELSSGNAFNAFPPGWEKDFVHFRDYMNIKHDWTRPDDPDHKRMFTPSNADIIEARLTRWGENPTKNEKDNVRKEINNFIQGRIENGLIHDRADIISTLQEVGLQINREGKNYISVKDPDNNIKIRLKGGVYEHQWRAANATGEATRESKAGTGSNPEDVQGELAKIEQGLTTVIRKRALYNENRYPSANQENIKETFTGSTLDEQNIPKIMGEESIHRSSSIDRDVHSSVFHSRLASPERDRSIQHTGKPEESDNNSVQNSSENRGENLWDSSSAGQRRQVYCVPNENQTRNEVDSGRSPSSKNKIIINAERINTTFNSTNIQGEQNENSQRNRNNNNGEDRRSKTGNKVRIINQFRKTENRISKNVRSYNSKVGMVRRICRSIGIITEQLCKIREAKQRSEKRSISIYNDFER